ncbi:MAG: hypothetical protein ACXAD7_21850, partial [Candidatus Kariarchaeaceae archaeon]
MSTDSTEKKQIYQEFEHGVDPKIKAAGAIFGGFIGTIILAWVLGSESILGNAMNDVQDTFWYHMIPFLFSTIFFAILVFKAYVKNIRGLSFLASAVMLYGMAEFLFMIADPGEGTTIFERDNNLAAIADLLVPMAVVMLYFHIELIEKRRPGIIHAVGIIGTALPLIVGGILIIIFDGIDRFDTLVEDIRAVATIYLGLFALIILWIGLFGFRVMYGTLKHADSPDTTRGSLFVLLGFSSLIT